MVWSITKNPLFLLLVTVTSILAHGVGYELIHANGAQYVRFSYTDGKPVAYAEVTVKGPFDSEVEYQNGRSDRRGGFAFMPDTSGVWYVRVVDGQAHETTAEILIKKNNGNFEGERLTY